MAGTKGTGTQTRADVILAMLNQELTRANQKVSAAYTSKAPNAETIKAEARGERAALTAMRDRVKRYLAGDNSAIYG